MLGIAGILLQKRAREIRAFAMERASVGFAATPQLCGFLLAFGSAQPAARIHPGALLSPLIDDDFGVAPFVAVFADQKVVFVRGQAITAVAALFVQLVSQVYFVIIPEANGLSAGQGVGKIYVSAQERVEAFHLFHIRDVQRVEFRDELLFQAAWCRKRLAMVFTTAAFAALGD